MTDLDRSHPSLPAPDSGADPVSLTAAPPPAARPAKKDVPSAETIAVWKAEDGRCEACTRPMDRACAGVAIDQPSSLPRLVCPDCNNHRPDPLAVAVVGSQTAQVLAVALATTVETAAVWLVEGLRAYGVLLRLDDRRHYYWLPGVGTFTLFVHRPDRPWVGGPFGKLKPHPTIRVTPQARTRGLPRLPQPDSAGFLPDAVRPTPAGRPVGVHTSPLELPAGWLARSPCHDCATFARHKHRPSNWFEAPSLGRPCGYRGTAIC